MAVNLKAIKSPPVLIASGVITLCWLATIFPIPFLQDLEWMTYDGRVKARAYVVAKYPGVFSQTATNLGFTEISDNTIELVARGTLGYSFGLYWPRQVYGRAIQELHEEGAKAIAFDVMFDNLRPDQDNLEAELPGGAKLGSDSFFAFQLAQSRNVILGADTEVLPQMNFRKDAAGIGNISVVKDKDGVLRRTQTYVDYKVWAPHILDLAADLGLNLAKTKVEPGHILFYFQRPRFPEDLPTNNIAPDDVWKIGTTNTIFKIMLPTDSEGTLDTTLFVNPLPEGEPPRVRPFKLQRVWSLGMVLAAWELGLDLEHPKIEPSRITLVSTNNPGLVRVIPIDQDKCFEIDWTILRGDPVLAEADVGELLMAQGIRESKDTNDLTQLTNRFAGRLVVVGSVATGNDLADRGPTPLESNSFLASKHWNVANTVITGSFIKSTPQWLDMLLITFLGCATAWFTWKLRPLAGSLGFIVLVAAYSLACTILFVKFRCSLPIVLPAMGAAGVNYVSLLLYRVLTERNEKMRVKGVFSKMVAPEVVNELLAKENLSMDGQRLDITVYFADVRGFTTYTDSTQAHAEEHVKKSNLAPKEAEAYYDAQAQETLRTVNQYLATISDTIKQHKGTLDKYIGDCVMAFWGAPVPNKLHARDCVLAAIDSQLAMNQLNLEREAQNKKREEENVARAAAGQPLLPMLARLAMGSGINSGVCIVGLMGSQAHVQSYTVFGREVNLASRLEGVSGYGRIIIGQSTHAALLRDDPTLAATCVPLPPVMVKGIKDPVPIFEVPWKQRAEKLADMPEPKKPAAAGH